MATSVLEVNVRREPGVAVLDLRGEINGAADEALNAAYADAVAEAPARVLLNFSEVTYINSTGIALIVGLLAQARKGHVEVLASGLSDHYREIFEITRLADFVHIVTDEQSALDGPALDGPALDGQA
jgi:anti-sigma B factor antagonist